MNRPIKFCPSISLSFSRPLSRATSSAVSLCSIDENELGIEMEIQTEDWVPQLKKEFQTEEQAYLFWVQYSRKIGFRVRKQYSHKSRVDGVVTSVVFVCTNQGKIRQKAKRIDQIKPKKFDRIKCPRAETRTNCQVRLIIKFNRETDKFEVVDFVSDHNHPLQRLVEASSHVLLPNNRESSEITCCDIDLVTDNSGIIRPEEEEAHEFMSRRNRDLYRKFAKIVAKAACNEEFCALIDDSLDTLDKQLEEKMQKNPPNTSIDSDNFIKKPPLLNKKGGKQTQSRVKKMQKTSKRKTTDLSGSETKRPNIETPNSAGLKMDEPSQEEYGYYIELEDKCDVQITF